jgi:hypothetical protein
MEELDGDSGLQDDRGNYNIIYIYILYINILIKFVFDKGRKH